MDDLNREVLQVLAECRKAMSNQLIYVYSLQEENRQLQETLLRHSHEEMPTNLPDQDTYRWKRECIEMQNSLSWRVTKPLRLVQKVLTSLRISGLRYTVKKIVEKLGRGHN